MVILCCYAVQNMSLSCNVWILQVLEILKLAVHWEDESAGVNVAFFMRLLSSQATPPDAFRGIDFCFLLNSIEYGLVDNCFRTKWSSVWFQNKRLIVSGNGNLLIWLCVVESDSKVSILKNDKKKCLYYIRNGNLDIWNWIENIYISKYI